MSMSVGAACLLLCHDGWTVPTGRVFAQRQLQLLPSRRPAQVSCGIDNTYAHGSRGHRYNGCGVVELTRGIPMTHYVYMLRCADETYYTGYTTDPKRRVEEHNAGTGAKYTRGRTPVELVHVEAYDTRSAALTREHEIKSLSRDSKAALIAASRDPSLCE